jgi:hypothetical protein
VNEDIHLFEASAGSKLALWRRAGLCAVIEKEVDARELQAGMPLQVVGERFTLASEEGERGVRLLLGEDADENRHAFAVRGALRSDDGDDGFATSLARDE